MIQRFKSKLNSVSVSERQTTAGSLRLLDLRKIVNVFVLSRRRGKSVAVIDVYIAKKVTRGKHISHIYRFQLRFIFIIVDCCEFRSTIIEKA